MDSFTLYVDRQRAPRLTAVFVWALLATMWGLGACASAINKSTRSTGQDITVSERKEVPGKVFVSLGESVARRLAGSQNVDATSCEVVLLLLRQIGINNVRTDLITSLPEWQQATSKISKDLNEVAAKGTVWSTQLTYSVNIMAYRHTLIASGLGTIAVGSNNWSDELKRQYSLGLHMVIAAVRD